MMPGPNLWRAVEHGLVTHDDDAYDAACEGTMIITAVEYAFYYGAHVDALKEEDGPYSAYLEGATIETLRHAVAPRDAEPEVIAVAHVMGALLACTPNKDQHCVGAAIMWAEIILALVSVLRESSPESEFFRFARDSATYVGCEFYKPEPEEERKH